MDLQHYLSTYASTFPIITSAVFVLVRASAVVVSPIPGALIDIPAIAVFGWKRAFILSEIGVLVGAIICFYIGRSFRPLVSRHAKFMGTVHAWEARLSERETFWTWVGIRLPTNPAFDYISYAAGLTNCTFSMFIATTFVGSLPSMLIFFYFSGTALQYGLAGGLLAVAGLSALFWGMHRLLTHRNGRPNDGSVETRRDGQADL